MVKQEEWYKPDTDLCKDTKGNIIGDKKQNKWKWNKHLEELLNENKHKNKRAALDTEQNQMHTQNGITSTNKETQMAIQKLNNKAPGIDGIPVELLKQRKSNK